MRALFLDCFSGISGDMTVGALCDLGVKPSTFEWELSKLGIGDFHLHFERRKSQGIEGVKFSVHTGAVHTHDQDEEPDEHGQVHAQACSHDHDHHEHAHGEDHHHESHGSHESHAHEHEHAHGDHEHTHNEHQHAHDEREHADEHEHAEEHEHGRSYVEIRALIEQSDLSNFVKEHALSIFHRVAVAEAKIHGAPVDAIGFHEVGALDSITDIVCACVGIEELAVEKIFVGPLSDGRGWVNCAHGRYPIPTPAALEILTGIPIGQIDEPFEFITPTGAAIAVEFGAGFGAMPRLKVERIGYGLGSRQITGRPNALRAVLGEWQPGPSDAAAGAVHAYATDTITQIETNLDDLSPEITGAVVDKLFAAGVLDVFLTPIQMKKNRPAVLLTVLCEDGAVERASDLIFRETSSFGLRLSKKERFKLDRRIESVDTAYGRIEVKLGYKEGRLLQAAPEYESCRAASERTGEPLRAVYLAAAQAFPLPGPAAK